MTDPVTLGVAAVTAGVAMLAGYHALPRPPELDAERWFKILLATVLRGHEESRGGTAASWEDAVLRFVPYHPAGRLPEQKIVAPELFAYPGGEALDGERALVEALAAVPRGEPRYARMYDDDEAAVIARLQDPVELGPAYDPSTWLGPEVTWDAVAAWEGVGEVLRARSDARWVLVRGPDTGAPSVVGALADTLGDAAIVVSWRDVPPEEAAERIRRLVSEAVRDNAGRFVLVGEAEGAHLVTRAMVEDAGLRDRVLAVASIGGVLRGRPGREGPYGAAALEDWMARWFRHEHLETEAVGRTPWFSLEWLDRSAEPPGIPGLPLANARFPSPPPDRGEVWGIETVDLGPLSADPELPVGAVARALQVFVVGWLAAQR